ncbi:hypothetical protein MN116_008956 [Schistosoma mekongi]|uniref:Pre-mRNA-processing factor 39 n=1 Tax=Schistosoma mekongi TaxID=38744 RepID=A0AAE2D1C6_SCHME|nr:hypothetical protein MN116_008956 [Schistosoma mekongi]
MSFHKLWRKAQDNPTEFSVWISLLDLVEKQQNIEYARQAFDAFFKRFPYCYGYWKKFADMERHKGNRERCLQVFEMGVKTIPLSVDLWTAYLDAAIEYYHTHDDYETKMRSLYESALDSAGLEFRSDALWEHYISWESGHNRLVNAANIYARLLSIPTQLYFQNWDSFNKLVEENRPEDILSKNELASFLAKISVSAGKPISLDQSTEEACDGLEPPILGSTKPVMEITDAIRSSLRQMIIDSREQIYRATYMQIMRRWYFEEKIRRPYFHVKPLEEVQLNNWAEYLSFEEAEAATVISHIREQIKATNQLSDDKLEEAVLECSEVKLAKRRVRVLYERCLVACALYEHLWIRYAKYLEYTEGDIPAAREVWRRACNTHLPYKPTIHWHWGCFEDRYPANLDNPQRFEVLTCLDILTDLEKRLTDSALVCCRRADALRRAGKPLFDIISCLRNGINRLRYLVQEQNKVAQCVSGATASRTVAQAIATAAQARAGAGVLAGRLARLFHRNKSLCSDGIPVWMLLLSTKYEEEKDDESMIIDLPKIEETNSNEKIVEEESTNGQTEKSAEVAASPKASKVDEEVTLDKSKDIDTLTSEPESDSEIEAASSDNDVTMDEEIDDENSHKPVMDTTTTNKNECMSEDAIDESSSPPILVVPCSQKKKKHHKRKHRESKRSRRKHSSSKKAKSENEGSSEEEKGEDNVEDQSGDESKPAPEVDQTAEEEERIRILLNRRHKVIEIRAPSPSELTDEDLVIISSEEAAIRVLKEAIDYDPRNERLYAQLLDIIYQRTPVDIEGFIEATNLATIDSVLPAHIKLAFCQRKLQFLEEFDSDLSRLNATYEEYMNLCDAINTGVTTSAIARGASRLMSGYQLPDLLNLPTTSLRVSSVIGANPCEMVVSAAPVGRTPCLNTDQSALEAAASVGTPAPEPSTAAGYYTAGGYEPLAAALGNTSGLPPSVPTGIPVMTPSVAILSSVSDTSTSGAAGLTADAYATYYYTAASGASSVLAPVVVPAATVDINLSASLAVTSSLVTSVTTALSSTVSAGQ